MKSVLVALALGTCATGISGLPSASAALPVDCPPNPASPNPAGAIFRLNPVMAQATDDLWDVSNGAKVVFNSGTVTQAANNPADAFGAISLGNAEPELVSFSDGQPAGTVHALEWTTPTPVTIRSFRVIASENPPPGYERAFTEFRLYTFDPGTGCYSHVYHFTSSTPYIPDGDSVYNRANGAMEVANLPATTASHWRLEVVQRGSAQGGPRLWEVDGFASTEPPDLSAKIEVTAEKQAGGVHIRATSPWKSGSEKAFVAFTTDGTNPIPETAQDAANGFVVPEGTEVRLRTYRANRYRGAVLSPVSVIQAGATLCANPPANAVAWYRGQDNGRDSAGGHQASLVDGAGFGSGAVCRGFVLNGTDGRIEVPNAPDLNFGPGQDLSVEGWFQAAAGDPRRIISLVDKRNAPDEVNGQPFAAAVGYTAFLENGILGFQLGDQPLGSPFHNFYSSSGNLRDGQWHHFVVSVARSSTTGGRFYLDGQPAGTFDPTVEPGDLSNDQPLRIGNHASPSYNGTLRGALDEVVIYRRALSAQEAAARFASAAGAACCRNVAVSLIAPATAPQGAAFKTTAVVSAEGDGTNTGTLVRQTLPAGASIVGSQLSRGSLTVTAGVVEWEVGTLSGSTNATMELVIRPAAGRNPLVNSVSVNSTGGNDSTDDDTATAQTAVLSGDCAAPAGLVAWWPGNGSAQDAAGTNHLDFTGGSYQPGVVGPSFVVFNRVPVAGDSPALNPSELSLEAWVFPEILNGETSAILTKESAAGLQYGLALKGPLSPQGGTVPTGHLLIAVGGVSGLRDDYAGWTDSGVALPLSDWSHVVLTVGGNVARLYVNGAVARAWTGLGGAPAAVPGSSLRLGGRFPDRAGADIRDPLNGQLDEVSLYNRALDGAEVLALFNAGATGKCQRNLGVTFGAGPATVSSSAAFTLNLSVTNTGPGNALDVAVALPVPLGAAYLSSVASAGTSSLAGDVVHFDVGPLAAGGSATLSVQLQAPAGAGVLTNTATLSVTGVDSLAADNTAVHLVQVFKSGPCVEIPGILGWWGGNDSARDRQSTNHGTLEGPVGYTAAVVTNGFVFNGLDTRVALGQPAEFQVQNLSIEGWVRRDSAEEVTLSGNAGFFLAGDAGGFGFGIQRDGRLLFTQVGISFVTSDRTLTEATNWHHVAITKVDRTVTFYLDGAPAGTRDFPNVFAYSRPFAIGALGGVVRDVFLGGIDEITLYGRALTADEVKAIREAGPAGKCQTAPAFVEQDCDITFKDFTAEGARFSTGAGAKVVVERSTDLRTWSRFEVLADAAGLVVLGPPPAGEAYRFYRVISARCLVPR